MQTIGQGKQHKCHLFYNDNFSCDSSIPLSLQLDRYRSPSISVSERQSSPSIPDSFRGKLKLQTRFLDGSVEGDLTLSARDLNTRRSSRRHSGNHEKNVPSWLEGESYFLVV